MHGSQLKIAWDYAHINKCWISSKPRPYWFITCQVNHTGHQERLHTNIRIRVALSHQESSQQSIADNIRREVMQIARLRLLWHAFMQSHSHSTQAVNYICISEKVYKILYTSNDKLGHLVDAANPTTTCARPPNQYGILKTKYITKWAIR